MADIMQLIDNPLLRMGSSIMGAPARGGTMSQIGLGMNSAIGALQDQEARKQRLAMMQQEADQRQSAADALQAHRESTYGIEMLKMAQGAGVDPTNIARQIKEAYGLNPGDPGYIQAFERLVKMRVPGGNQGLSTSFLTEKEQQQMRSAGVTDEIIKRSYKDRHGEIKQFKSQPVAEQREADLREQIQTSAQDISEQAGGMDMDFRGGEGILRAKALNVLATGGEGLSRDVANVFAPDDIKKLAGQYTELISNIRTLMSGAAVPEQEVVRDAGVYVPQPNDSPEMSKHRIKLAKRRAAALERQKFGSDAEEVAYRRQQRLKDEQEIMEMDTKSSKPITKSWNDLP